MAANWIGFLLLTFAGSSLGGLCRYLLSGWVSSRFGERFPAGTMVVNVSGALLIGFIWAAAAPGPLRDFLTFGFLGGYTTVSSFTLNTLNLLQDGEWLYAGWNLAGTYALCLAAVFAGAGFASLMQNL